MCTINIFNLDLKDPRGLKPWQKCLLFVVLLVVVGVSIVTAVVVIVPTVPPQGNVCIFERRFMYVEQICTHNDRIKHRNTSSNYWHRGH